MRPTNKIAYVITACLLTGILIPASSPAAELRTFSYTDLTNNAANKIPSRSNFAVPTESGLIFTWPRTKISYLARFVVESQVAGFTTNKDDKPVKTPLNTNYVVRLDPTATNLITITYADDPNLRFYLVPVGGFFTDVKEGKVTFVENSGGIKSISVKYEDKIAKFITDTIKLAAEVVGIVAGTQTPKSLTVEKIPYLDHEIIDDLGVTLTGEITLAEEASGTTSDVDYQIPGVPAGMQELLTALNDRLKRLSLGELKSNSTNWNAIDSMKLQVTTDAPVRKLTDKTLLSLSTETKRMNGSRVPYFAGLPYRVPADGKVTVTIKNKLQEAIVAQKTIKVPEAGTIGWFQFKSRALANTSPSLTLDALGGITEASFAQSAASENLSTILEQAKTSASDSLDAFKKKEAAEKKAATEAAAADAALQTKIKLAEFDLASLDSDISTITAKIAQINAALTATPPPAKDEKDKLLAELQTLTTDLRTKERARLAKQLELDYLKKGIEIKP